MPRIEIKEQDTTSFGSFVESHDIVYVPGLVDVDAFTDSEKALKYRQPRLFTSVNEFKSLCGDTPVKFAKDQMYSSLVTENTAGFSVNAIPFDGVMFKAGDADPGYLYAIELLNSGLSVLYERINPDQIKLQKVPAFGSIDYYGVDPSEFVPYTDVHTAPEDMFISIFGDDYSPGTAMMTLSITYEGGSFKWDIVEGPQQEGTLYVRNNLGRFVGYSTLNDLAEAIPQHPDIKVSKNSTGTVTSIQITDNKPELVNIIHRWEKDKVFETYPDGSKSIVVNTMPVNWYTNFSEYGRIGAKQVKADQNNYLRLQAPFSLKDVDAICTLPNIYAELADAYTSSEGYGLMDKGNYSFKYLTSGGYPTYEYNGNSIVSAMMTLAQSRGDCVALIDHTDNEGRETDINFDDSLYGTVKKDSTFSSPDLCSYATMFTPTATYSMITQNKSKPRRMPASFGYLLALSGSIQSNAPWLAIAGAARGGVPHLSQDGMTTVIPNGVADMMQPRNGIAVNAITNIRPYGQTIWGNRTLRKSEDLVATSFLNVRNLISDVKKLCYQVARSLTFEQDNDVLWVNFKSMIAPTLDKMVSGYGISGYKIIKDENRLEAQGRAVVCAKVYLHPVYPVEDFYIDIILSDEDVVVE